MGKNCAVIVAAGKGTRMGAKIGKQFIEVQGKPILYYTLKTFSQCDVIDEIFLVLSKDDIEYCKVNILDKFQFNKPINVVVGGMERQDSVYNGLKAIGKCDVVLIHDGARPFVDESIIKEGIKNAEKYGACTCGVVPKDTIKVRSQDGFSAQTPNRNFLFAVQTPQCFRYDIILQCHEKVKIDALQVTDDTMIVEHYGYKVFLFEGSYKNIKVTTPEDLILAEGILNKG